MHPRFHLSLDVASVEEDSRFFTRVLKATLTHADPSGYVNVEWNGCQITLQSRGRPAEAPGVHFGGNFPLDEFEALATHVQQIAPECIVGPPKVTDAGTPLERKKMYLRCPSGYRIELKGYRNSVAGRA